MTDAQFATVIDDYKAIEDVVSQAGVWWASRARSVRWDFIGGGEPSDKACDEISRVVNYRK